MRPPCVAGGRYPRRQPPRRRRRRLRPRARYSRQPAMGSHPRTPGRGSPHGRAAAPRRARHRRARPCLRPRFMSPGALQSNPGVLFRCRGSGRARTPARTGTRWQRWRRRWAAAHPPWLRPLRLKPAASPPPDLRPLPSPTPRPSRDSRLAAAAGLAVNPLPPLGARRAPRQPSPLRGRPQPSPPTTAQRAAHEYAVPRTAGPAAKASAPPLAAAVSCRQAPRCPIARAGRLLLPRPLPRPTTTAEAASRPP
mmetsp:Transcript_15904/g.46401  ORF Transcript_15904/g.46401 Transcript_15904/m.46401 type:complete len:252 (-) Transcript_15904:301-1056(-)